VAAEKLHQKTVDEKSQQIQNQNMVQQKTTQRYAAVREDQFTEKKKTKMSYR